MVTPGCTSRKPATMGGRMSRTTAVGTLSLSVPVGLSRKSVHGVDRCRHFAQRRDETFQQAHAGLRSASRCGVVRLSRRRPSRVSSRRTASLRRRCGGAAHRGGSAKAAVGAPRPAKASRSARSSSLIVRYSALSGHSSLFDIPYKPVSVMTDYRTKRQSLTVPSIRPAALGCRSRRTSHATPPARDPRSHSIGPRSRLHGHVGHVWPVRAAGEHRHDSRCPSTPASHCSTPGDFYGMGHNEMLIGEALKGRAARTGGGQREIWRATRSGRRLVGQ